MRYFNPRSREWSDIFRILFSLPLSISIHAPASGATVLFSKAAPSATISIHAPASGATGYSILSSCPFVYFNPRSREWSDFSKFLDNTEKLISIHAPASGATEKCHSPLLMRAFQSTLPRVERRHLLTFFRLQYGYILFHLTNKYSFCF